MKKLPMKRLIIAAVAVLAVVGIVIGVIVARSGQTGLSIDGQAISQQELDYAIDSVKNTVMIQTAPEGSSVGADFWDDTATDSPAYKAGQMAVEVLKHRYAWYQIGAESGLIDSDAWDGVVSRMDEDNQRRSTDQESGSPAFGPSSLDVSEYVDYEMSSIEEAYVADPSHPGMDVSDQEIAEHFKAHQWTDADGNPATLDQVYSNVVDDLRRTKFQALVAEREKTLDVNADAEQMARSVSSYLGS